MSRVEEAILADARTQANRLLEEAKALVEQDRLAQLDRGRKENDSLIAIEQKSLESQHQQSLSDVRLAYAKQLAQFREEELSHVYSKVENAFLELPKKKQYREFMKRLGEQTGKEFKNPTVLVRKQDAALLPKHWKKKLASIKGGFVAQNESGDIELDYRLESVLEREKENVLALIQKTILGEEKK